MQIYTDATETLSVHTTWAFFHWKVVYKEEQVISFQ